MQFYFLSGFYKYMVVEVANPLNQKMHNGDKPVVGVIPASDALPNRVLYTNANANRVYNDIQYDIYQGVKNASPPKKGGFPPVLKILAAAVLLGTAIIFRKNIWKFCKNIFRKIKNIFRKSPSAPPTTSP